MIYYIRCLFLVGGKLWLIFGHTVCPQYLKNVVMSLVSKYAHMELGLAVASFFLTLFVVILIGIITAHIRWENKVTIFVKHFFG